MTVRFDVREVPLQGGYAAKRCPVVIQNDILVPEARVEVPLEVLHRMQAGSSFENVLLESVGERGEGDGSWLVIPSGPADVAKELTVKAMDDRTPVIENAFLPDDPVGRRTGRPDLLVYSGDGYVPVDIKHHKTLDPGDGNVLVSDVAAPSPEDAYPLDGQMLRPHEGDALQLAHYRRMLETSGHAAASTLAGIIGKEGLVVWYNLEEPMWTTPAKNGANRKKRTSLERYDFEFGFRLDIAATALAHRASPDVELLVEPMQCDECASCAYREHCGPILWEGSGDSSLLIRFGYDLWRMARDHGVVTRGDIAGLHYPTARLASQGVELPTFLALAEGQAPDIPVAELRPLAKKQIERLAEAGIRTVADLRKVDRRTAELGGRLADPILEARAAVDSEPVYRRPGAAGEVPRADIEVDVDMEDTPEGVYMWGTLLTDRTGSGRFEEGYRPFIHWENGDEETEQILFDDFWSWLGAQREQAARLGLSFKVYVWAGPSAEYARMRRIAGAKSERLAAEIEAFIASYECVDLLKVFTSNWITGGSASLKPVSAIAGYHYPVDDPGGGYSMMARDLALGADDPDTHRQWILDYNRGDVEATKHIREWLDANGRTWPEVRTD